MTDFNYFPMNYIMNPLREVATWDSFYEKLYKILNDSGVCHTCQCFKEHCRCVIQKMDKCVVCNSLKLYAICKTCKGILCKDCTYEVCSSCQIICTIFE